MRPKVEQTVLVRSIKNPKVTRRMTVNSARLNSAYWETVELQPQTKAELSKIEIIQPKGAYNVAAIIPVHGRLPLITQTIKRLLSKNNIDFIVCVCSTQGEADYIQQSFTLDGLSTFVHDNKPLGSKWNAGFIEAKKFNPDACLFVGSSDWLSDNWVSSLLPLTSEFDMVGTPGCHFLDIKDKNKFRVINWGGYIGDRSNESIGIGRLLSARILKKLNWKPFTDGKDGSLDYDMLLRVKRAFGKVTMVRHPELISLSISTDQWSNKHRFEDHVKGELRRNSFFIPKADQFIKANFPEAYHVFQ